LRSKRIIAIAVAVLAVMALPAIALGRPIFVGGSTSVEPLAKKLAAAYHHAFPHRPIIKVSGGQSDIGISGVASGRFDIGDSSRDPEKTDPAHLVFIKIARDAVCLVTNPSNPLENLTKQTVERIYTGVYTNWAEVPGASASLKNSHTPISVFDRDSASGTQDAFRHIFLPGAGGEAVQQVTPRASALASNGQERAAVQGTPGGIGFVSLAFTNGVHTVPYEGIPCTLHNARSGQYRGTRNFWMVTHHVPKGQVLKFLRWVISGNATTKRIINSDWIAVH
jgi:phosphate transport system substrate-binding protein